VDITLMNGTGYSVETTTAVTSNIVNDDTQVTLAVAPANVKEDGTANIVYTFTRTGALANALAINYEIGGTATFNSDYTQTGATNFTGTSGTVTFAAGSTTAKVIINPTADSTLETDENVELKLTSGAGYSIGTTNTVTSTIVNDDTQVTLAVAPATVNEDGVTNIVYTFTRAGVLTNALTVNYGVGGTAKFNSDYTQTGAATFTTTNGTVTFAAGATTATVTIDPTADGTFEVDEDVALALAKGTGYNVGTATAVTSTILNDDLLPAISIADVTIVEGIDGSSTKALVTVSLDRISSQSISVNYATSNATAIAGTDYTTTSGTLTFNPSQTSLTIAVPILNDNVNELNETFDITLSAPTNATIADNQATITVTDTLSASVTTILPALVENLTLTGSSDINGTGNTGNNILIGNSANNILTGLNGADIYLYNADLVQGLDTINETTTGGIDTLDFSQTATAVDVDLSVTSTQTVNANLQLLIPIVSVENFIGGSGNDRITGNDLANVLQGGLGNNQISGGAGNDTIFDQGGNDIISGGTGNDIFSYSGSLVGSTTAKMLFGANILTDFTTGQDKISLSKTTFGAITSTAGTSIGSNFSIVNDDTKVETQAAAIVYSLSSGSLYYNQNGVTLGLGTNGGEFTKLTGSPSLTISDFKIVV
jgi:Ca2+-binding RTX toxin-like protein